jgi:hypothetical protein
MRFRPTKRIVVPCVIVVLMVAGAVAGLRLGRASSEEPDIVMRVNGEPVTRGEWIGMVAEFLPTPHAPEAPGAKKPDQTEAARRAMQNLIARRLLLQEAGRRNVTATEQEVDRALNALPHRLNDASRLLAWLRARGADTRSLRDTVRAELIATRVRDAVVSQARVSDEQVQAYYDAHEAEMATKALADARPQIERRLLSEKQRDQLWAWLTAEEKKSKIEVIRNEKAAQK